MILSALLLAKLVRRHCLEDKLLVPILLPQPKSRGCKNVCSWVDYCGLWLGEEADFEAMISDFLNTDFSTLFVYSITKSPTSVCEKLSF